jgi:c-di-GMP-binding flagellar brake protein YcgR
MDTRACPRVTIALKVVSRIEEGKEQSIKLATGNRFEAASYDISTVGIGIVTRDLLPKGLVMQLEIEGAPFGLKGPIAVKGEVRYCNYVKSRKYKCGVKFLSMSEKHKKAIAKFVSAHSEQEKTRTSPS